MLIEEEIEEERVPDFIKGPLISMPYMLLCHVSPSASYNPLKLCITGATLCNCSLFVKHRYSTHQLPDRCSACDGGPGNAAAHLDQTVVPN